MANGWPADADGDSDADGDLDADGISCSPTSPALVLTLTSTFYAHTAAFPRARNGVDTLHDRAQSQDVTESGATRMRCSRRGRRTRRAGAGSAGMCNVYVNKRVGIVTVGVQGNQEAQGTVRKRALRV